MNSIIYLDGEIVYTNNPDINEMILALITNKTAKQAVSRLTFPISEEFLIRNGYDGYYGFKNVKHVSLNGMFVDPEIFDTEVFIPRRAFFTQFHIYPIDPKLPMSANVVVYGADKFTSLKPIEQQNCESLGQIMYRDYTAGVRIDEIQKLY